MDLPSFRGELDGVRQEIPRNLLEAVRIADRLAREALAARDTYGDRTGAGAIAGATGTPVATVLLSPAAASFDMFVDYAARGRAFKAAVAGLATLRRGS